MSHHTPSERRITVLICTHNRADLLDRAIRSLDTAVAPPGWQVDILVIANACTDSTHRLLQDYAEGARPCRFRLRWAAEPKPGKSNALNTAIGMFQDGVVAFVDDDHRVDPNYIKAICEIADAKPDFSMFCGRIYPDWDGREPAWVHDEGPYRIRPLPVPRSDSGPNEMEITSEHRLPGGGNLAVRTDIFKRVGNFSTDLGPHGHDLGGGEDTEFLLRARNAGERMAYTPAMVQYHYADPERLKTGYVLRKAYHRSRTSTETPPGQGGVPLYMWRKATEYAGQTIFSMNSTKRLHFAIRLAATLGEMRAAFGKRPDPASPSGRRQRRNAGYLLALASLLALGLASIPTEAIPRVMLAAEALCLVALPLASALVIKALRDYSQTGPRIPAHVRQHFQGYGLRVVIVQGGAVFLLLLLLAAPGVAIHAAWSTVLGAEPSGAGMVFAALASMLAFVFLQYCRHLLFLPASIVASSHYRMSRFYRLWSVLTPARIKLVDLLLTAIAAISLAVATANALAAEHPGWLLPLAAFAGFYACVGLWARPPAASAPPRGAHRGDRPNILMIGADTLRADRVDGSYRRALTPNLQALAQRGTLFTSCYVPCARTAPSLISLLSGVWPHRHGVRDNYVEDAATRLKAESLPAILRRNGYLTAAISDWCGADMGKFSFGFEYVDLPPDQWNIRYLLRQGPKDLRLLLSLFARNPAGRALLPELYALGGVPTTDPLGRDTRELIDYLAGQPRPFLLNAFLSTTHGPFGSEYPYYTKFSSPAYRGESKFAMARVSDPFEIIRRQGEPRTEFDLDQILDLYDGCVSRFDDEVGHILAHLDARGLADNTIVVIYSDHGMDFFEFGTWGQGNSVRGDTSSRTPLLIVDPRLKGQGPRPEVVRSIDLFPTLLELTDTHGSSTPDGISLCALLNGSKESSARPAFNETGIWLTDLPGTPSTHLRYPPLMDLLDVVDLDTGTISLKREHAPQVVLAKDRMIRKGRWKLTFQPLADGPLLRLYDAIADPGFETDVIDLHPGIAAELWLELRTWLLNDPELAREAPRARYLPAQIPRRPAASATSQPATPTC